MRVLFIYRTASLDVTDPLGIMSISAVLKRAGHTVDLLIPNLEGNLFKKVREFAPEIIGFSVTTGSEDYYLEISRALKKELSFTAVFGGPHPTFFPDVLKCDGVDAICRGEGDEAIVEFADRLEKGEDVTNVLNFHVKNNGQIYQNPLRPLVSDLDTLPFVDRDILNKYAGYRYSRLRFFLSSRGCPYDCTYCFNHSLKKMYKEHGCGVYIRQRSVEHVIREISQVKKKYKMKKVYFYDDIFVMNKPWIREFTKRYKEEFDLPFTCYLRVNLVTEELISNLASAGCESVALAIESGNEAIREQVLHRRMTNDQIREAARLLHKYNICFMTQNMVALPDESIENAFETIQLNADIRPGYAWCSIFQPYIGTDVYNYCLEKGYLTIDHKQDITYQNEAPIKKEDKKQFENLHKLFGLAVEFPFILKRAKKLINWPKNPVFNISYRVFKGYTHFWRMRMSSFDPGFLVYLLCLIRYKIMVKLKRTM
jgi:radical SAM superfamily enzyme YgiQ (UPF0313 family)